jgi:hypothetical protein
MKTFKILVILSAIFSFPLENAKGQISQKLNYPIISGSTSISTTNSDTSFGRSNTFGLYGLNIVAPSRISIIHQPKTPGFGNADTMNGRWGILIWKPDFATSTNYSHSPRTNNSSLYNSGWYRMAGNIFNMYTETKYRIPSAPNR